jgi:Uma2 family endonuclease
VAQSNAVRLFPGLVRIPDVGFASWDCLPGRKRPRKPVPHIALDHVVEVLSKSNTKAEMARKLGEYFQAGVRVVWLVNPKTRSVHVYTAVDRLAVLTGNQSLDGGDVLPGFSLMLSELFARNEP